MVKGHKIFSGSIPQSGVPIKLSETALELQRFVEENGVDTFSVYMDGGDSPYGIVWLKGDTYNVMCGLHAMVADLAKNLGKTEQEIAAMVLAAKAKEVNITYQ